MQHALPSLITVPAHKETVETAFGYHTLRYEKVAGERRIEATLRGLLANADRGRLRLRGASRCLPTVVRLAEWQPDEEFPLRWELQGPVPTGNFQLEFSVYNTVMVIPVACFAMLDGRLTTRLPRWIHGVRHRRERRAPVPEGLDICLEHPVFQDVRVEHEVRNLSLYKPPQFSTNY